MKAKHFFTSLTRISDLPNVPFTVQPLSRREWETGDYVVGRSPHPEQAVPDRANERSHGRGGGGGSHRRGLWRALRDPGGGRRVAGDWARPDDGGSDRSGALREGYIEVCSPSPLVSLAYKGHVLIGKKKATMRDYAPEVPEREFGLPVVLLVGTSMSAGKTTSAKVIVRLLREAGLAVVGAKLTGAGRYRDILSMQDAGAEHIFDFVDAGLPSTVVPEKEYRQVLRRLLSRIATADADVLVAEVGASPWNPTTGRRR